jgi:hypothetical protein
VFVIERVTQLAPHIDAWSRLASSTSSPNAYYSPEFLIPNLEHVEHRPFVLLLVYDQTATDSGHTLVAFAPFILNAPNHHRPFGHLESFANKYVFGFNPLVDAVWDVLFQVLQDPAQPWQLTDLVFEADSEGLPPVLFQHVTAARAISCRKGLSRTWLHKPLAFDDFLNGLSTNARRNYRRALRRLGDLGTLNLQLHRRCENIEAVVDDFLILERSGWKGSNETAMACDEGHVEFLHQVARSFNAKGGLFYVELRLDGRLIAVSLAHTQGSALFAFKIAYDEAFARYSPGVVVLIETIRRFIEDPHLANAHGGTSVESWVNRYYTSQRELYSLCVPIRRALALAFSWGLKSFNRLRRVEIGNEVGRATPEIHDVG